MQRVEATVATEVALAGLVVALAAPGVDTGGVTVDVRTDSVIVVDAMANSEAGRLAAGEVSVAHVVALVVEAVEATVIRARAVGTGEVTGRAVVTGEVIGMAAEEGLRGMIWMTSACKNGLQGSKVLHDRFVRCIVSALETGGWLHWVLAAGVAGLE